MVRPILSISFLSLLPTFGTGAEFTPAQLDFFEKKIRPVLADKCFKCHSADAEKLKSGLQADHRKHLLAGGDSGPAINLTKPESSLLVETISYDNPDLQMPPKEKLSAEIVSDFVKWIADGAAWPDEEIPKRGEEAHVEEFDLEKRKAEHWSWRPVREPAIPEVENPDWPNSPIDQFILHRIEEAGLKPAEAADDRTWLRRVSFDLVGLPPSLEEIELFLGDPAHLRKAEAVDRLLASPHFGEKWARHWMDLVRYAETYGHEFDYPIDFAHEYRDYLIRAFNADVPFDQFAKEHIAGDLIEKPRLNPEEKFNESVLGTGFWYLHEATHAPTDVLADESDHHDNQIDAFAKSFLGLTVACARCHDHKFDAVSTADYYALTGYLHSSARTERSMDPGGARESAAAKQIKILEEANSTYVIPDWEKAVRTLKGAAELTRDPESETLAKARRLFTKTKQEAVPKESEKPSLENELLNKWMLGSLSLDEVAKQIENARKQLEDFVTTSVLYEDFNDDELPEGWSVSGEGFQLTGAGYSIDQTKPFSPPGMIDSGLLGENQSGVLRSPTFTIDSDQIHIKMRSEKALVRIVIDNYHMAKFNALLFRGTTHKNLSTKGVFQWETIGGNLKKYRGHKAYLEFVDSGPGSIQIDEIRFSDGPAPRSAPHPILRIFSAAEERTDLKSDPAAWNWLASHQLLEVEDPLVAKLLKEGAKLDHNLPPERFAVTMTEGTPENAFVYIRGSHRTPGEKVPPRFLEALGSQEGNRMSLAEEVASPENPLTSRVLVNRLWHHLFGKGLVPTVDDFGPMGQEPTHPELLDWLASDFVGNGWSIKKTIREIVLSRTYGQSGVAHPELDKVATASIDPNNALLHHMPVRRLQAEAIRDGILAVSGSLNNEMYGPSIPTHRTAFMTGRGGRGSGPLDGEGRRSIYGAVYRNFLSPFQLAFDMPNPFGPKGRRSVSNVPAQALALMNDPFIIDQSKQWAANSLAEFPDLGTEDRIKRMFEQLTAAPPDAETLARLSEFLNEQSKEYGTLDQRAWSDLAHALFNTKSFLYLN